MVRISRPLLERMTADMAREPLRERCGLLFGQAGCIEDWQPVANVHPAPARHFELDPAVLLAAMRAQRAGGMVVAGHVHSHPGSDSAPSPADADAAADGGRLWLIIGRDGPRLWRSVANGSHLGAFEPVPLSIIDEA